MRKIKYILPICIGVIIIIPIIFFASNSDNYKNHISNAEFYFSESKYKQAYNEIKDLIPQKEHTELFEKIKSVYFNLSYLDLAKQYLSSPSSSSDYISGLEWLLKGLRKINDSETQFLNMGLIDKYEDIKKAYLNELNEHFGVTEDEAMHYAYLNDEDQMNKIVEIVTNNTNQVNKGKVVIVDKSSKRDGDFMYASGAIRNDGDKTLTFVKVKVIYYDDKDNVIDTDWTYAVGSEGLKPNEQKYFEIMTKYRDGMKKYKLFIDGYN